MTLYHNDKKTLLVYHKNKRINEIYQGGQLRYSWFYPKGTVFTAEQGKPENSDHNPYYFPFDFYNYKFINFDHFRIANNSALKFSLIATQSSLPIGTSSQTETINGKTWYVFHVKLILTEPYKVVNGYGTYTFGFLLKFLISQRKKNGDMQDNNYYYKRLDDHFKLVNLNDEEIASVTTLRLKLQRPAGIDGIGMLLEMNGYSKDLGIKKIEIIKNHFNWEMKQND